MSQNEESKASTSQGVLAEVADVLQKSHGTVRTRLVQTLTERELVKRVDVLDKALVKRAQLQLELNKVRMPTKKVFKLVNGQMVEANVEVTYSPEEAKKYNEDVKQYNKQLKEATEKLQKFDNLLEKVFNGEGFDKLAAQVSGKDTDSTQGE